MADHLSCCQIFLVQSNLDEDLQRLPNLLDARDNDEFSSDMKKALRTKPVSSEVSKKSRCHFLGPNNIVYFKKCQNNAIIHLIVVPKVLVPRY